MMAQNKTFVQYVLQLKVSYMKGLKWVVWK